MKATGEFTGVEEEFAAYAHYLYALHIHCETCGSALDKQWANCPYCGPANSTSTAAQS